MEWTRLNREDTVEEYFLPFEHIQADRWAEFGCQEFQYAYEADPKRTEIRFTHLSHTTTIDRVLEVLQDKGFKAQGTKDLGPLLEQNLIWFGTVIDANFRDKVRADARQNFVAHLSELRGEGEIDNWLEQNDDKINQICDNFASSPVFEPNESRYGTYNFSYPIVDLLQAYKKHICNGGKVECRVLGTFAYKKETMHTIVVCPHNLPKFKKCPEVNEENAMHAAYPRPKINFAEWIWKPHSTGGIMYVVRDANTANLDIKTGYRRWEHVTFAFYMPNGEALLRVNDPLAHMKICAPAEINYQKPRYTQLTRKDSKEELLRANFERRGQQHRKLTKSISSLDEQQKFTGLIESDSYEDFQLLDKLVHEFMPEDKSVEFHRNEMFYRNVKDACSNLCLPGDLAALKLT